MRSRRPSAQEIARDGTKLSIVICSTIGNKLELPEARGLISILKGASNFMRAGGGVGEADELDQTAATVDKLLPK